MSYQLALYLPNCSGKGVRFKVLGPTEHEKLSIDAAKNVGSEATMLELKKLEWSMGVRRMITEVTVGTGYRSQDALLDPEVKWKKVTTQDLDANYEEWFTAKDHAVLCEQFRTHHEVSMDELKAISGKVLEVSGG